MKATVQPSDQQIGAAAEGADIIVGSGDVYDVVFCLRGWWRRKVLTHSQVITLGAPSAVLPALSPSLAHSANALH